MYILLSTTLFVLFQVYQSSGEIEILEWDIDPRNCYDQNGNTISCLNNPSFDCPVKRCNRRYYVGQERVDNIYEAKIRCHLMYMRLVSIETRDKWRDVLTELVKSADFDWIFYTSGQRTGDHNDFTWGSGCPFNYTQWGKDGSGDRQPDNWNNDEYCVEVSATALSWNDIPCQNGANVYNNWHRIKRSYMCESVTCY